MTSPLPINVSTTDWSADADKGAAEHREWHDSLHTVHNSPPGRLYRGAFSSTAAVDRGWVVPPCTNVTTHPLSTVGRILLIPATYGRSTIEEVRITVTTAAAGAGATVHCGIYDSDSLSGKPRNLIGGPWVYDSTTTGNKGTSGLTVPLDDGLVWLAFMSVGDACTLQALTYAVTFLHYSNLARIGVVLDGQTELPASLAAVAIIDGAGSGSLTAPALFVRGVAA